MRAITRATMRVVFMSVVYAVGLYLLCSAVGWEAAVGAFMLVWGHNIEKHSSTAELRRLRDALELYALQGTTKDGVTITCDPSVARAALRHPTNTGVTVAPRGGVP